MGSGGSSWDQSGDGPGGSILGSILSQFWVNSGPYLRNLIINLRKAFIWPWVGPLALEYVKYGSWEGPWEYPV